jgi:hypothetical protein
MEQQNISKLGPELEEKKDLDHETLDLRHEPDV